MEWVGQFETICGRRLSQLTGGIAELRTHTHVTSPFTYIATFEAECVVRGGSLLAFMALLPLGGTLAALSS